MYSLTRNQVSKVYSYIQDNKISYSHLPDDLVDHICSDIEERMYDGMSFKKAFANIKSEIGDLGLKKLQNSTLYLIDKNYRIMKNTSKIIGLIAFILLAIGTLLKIFHYPGASIAITIGFVLMIFYFFPAFIYTWNKENKTEKLGYLAIITVLTGSVFMASVLLKIQHWPGGSLFLTLANVLAIVVLIPSIVIYHIKKKPGKNKSTAYIIGGISTMILLTGNLFKINHWPGAAVLLLLGFVLLIVLFIPLYSHFEFKDTKSISSRFIFILIAGVYFIVFTSLMAINRGWFFTKGTAIINMNITDINNDINETNKFLGLTIDSEDTDNFIAMGNILNKSTELKAIIVELKKKIIINADQVSEMEAGNILDNIDNFQNRVSTKVIQELFIDQNKANNLYDKVLSLSQLAKPYSVSVKLLDIEDMDGWINYNFIHATTLGTINNLTLLENKISLIENEILNKIQSTN